MSTRSPIAIAPLFRSAPSTLRIEEVAAREVELVLVDDDPEVQTVAHQLAFGFGRDLHQLLQARHRRLTGQFVHEVAFGRASR